MKTQSSLSILRTIQIFSAASFIIIAALAMKANSAQASTTSAVTGDYLVQLRESANSGAQAWKNEMRAKGAKIEPLGLNNWFRVVTPIALVKEHSWMTSAAVAHVQSNFHMTIGKPWQLDTPDMQARVAQLTKTMLQSGEADSSINNLPIPMPGGTHSTGTDPLTDKQWGMKDIGVTKAWGKTKGSPEIIVAVIDTGVDYTHEDLVENLWYNKGEIGQDSQGRDKSNNQVDDDGNGYVDDIIGWDFVENDNKPYDQAGGKMDVISGKNPGHGTHCAGNIGARSDNGLGIAGVAPHVRIMPIRFIGYAGEGTTADAVKAIKYAVDNGARVLSNSWGSEGDDPAESTANQALKEAIIYAQSKNVLFVAAAGNGHQGVGYDNDSDPKPGVPASYAIDNIVSVAAMDSNNDLGHFSNWGLKTVHLGAPGVKVFSTTVRGNYNDVVADLSEYGMPVVTWDGTSMAAPHVAGAAALYWSLHPEKTYTEVKAALIKSAKPTSALAGKSVSGGRLDVEALMNQ